jgi:electron transport complex protein RnfC
MQSADNSLATPRWGIAFPRPHATGDGLPLQTAPVPEKLIVALNQNIGFVAKPIVRLGDVVLKGQPIGVIPENGLSARIHAPTSGKITAIERHPVPGRSDTLCVFIQADGVETSWAGYQAYSDPLSLPAARLREAVIEAGIVGLGGAMFPAGIKLNRGTGVDTLILNGAECEPCINCDDALIRHSPDSVLLGAQIMLRILEADSCRIALKQTSVHAIRSINEAIRKLGDDRITVSAVPSIYPVGGESQLIELLTGRQVPANGLPWDTGAICQNVATAAAIERFLRHGEPLISRIVTLTGKGLRSPLNLRTRIGTPIATLVEAAGGYTADARKLIMGGPMMGVALEDDELPVTKASNCFYVAAAGELPDAAREMPCIRCGECATACPANLMPQLLLQAQRTNDLDQLAQLGLPDCIECGCCDYVCPSHIPLTSGFRVAKQLTWDAAIEQRRAQHAEKRFTARQERLAAEADKIEQELNNQTGVFTATHEGHDELDELIERVSNNKRNDADEV